jgi:hydroxymethylpyrimidine pyrophosphatase-like HAD family hydrolase
MLAVTVRPDRWRAGLRYLALATDYDGTIAEDGEVQPVALAALRRAAAAPMGPGEPRRKLILVTGRMPLDFMEGHGGTLFKDVRVFDRVVMENGAVMWDPAGHHIDLLGTPPSTAFLRELIRAGVHPIWVGAASVSTLRSDDHRVQRAIAASGERVEAIYNDGWATYATPGVNKASGLRAACADLGIDPRQVIGVGDSENDEAFMRVCGLPVAVANAKPHIKKMAAWTTRGACGAGVAEVVDAWLGNTLDARSRGLA